MRTLDTLRPGESGVIETIEGTGALRRRLLDMGLTPGTWITVEKRAPLGDPIQLRLRGYTLTLRQEDAARVTLEEAQP